MKFIYWELASSAGNSIRAFPGQNKRADMLSDGKWGLCDLMMVNETKAKARVLDKVLIDNFLPIQVNYIKQRQDKIVVVRTWSLDNLPDNWNLSAEAQLAAPMVEQCGKIIYEYCKYSWSHALISFYKTLNARF